MSIICERCHYTSDNISNMYKHLNRKKPCNPIYSDLSAIELINKFKKYDKAIQDDNGNMVYKCRYCDKVYNLRSSRCTHQNNCQVKPYYDKIQDLTNKNKELINNQTNSTLSQSNTIINEFKNNLIEKVKNKMQQYLTEINESFINELNNNLDSNDNNFESIEEIEEIYDINDLLNKSLQSFYNKTYNQLNQN